MSDFYFVVLGEPVAKGRPRFGKGHVYTPKKTREGEATIAQHFNIKYPHNKVDSKSKFRVFITFACQKEFGSDLDNLIKAFFDALNGLLWADDKQVIAVDARRIWDEPSPYTEAWIKGA